MKLRSLHHVQLAMPQGQEKAAIGFYQGVLGLEQVPKPAALLHRGGVWFEQGNIRVHLGVEADFKPAKKAHPAFEVSDLDKLISQMEQLGIRVKADDNLEGFDRVYVDDPFGNRIELLKPVE